MTNAQHATTQEKIKNFSAEDLKAFCIAVFEKLNLKKQDAEIISDVIITAELKGIPSHGMSRLKRYINYIENKVININYCEKIETETPTTALINGDAGPGQVLSHNAMNKAIEKAKNSFIGFVSVKNSNHFGIAGYYSAMALKHNMIGICMSNNASLVLPTHGKEALIGSNPISIAVPANKEIPFLLDMSTSIVPRGEIENHAKHNKTLPNGWALDENGSPSTNTHKILNNINNRLGGGLLPLGGGDETSSGHKGFGLLLMVEILTGVLSGSGFLNQTYPKNNGKMLPSNVGHIFGAINIAGFRDLQDFKNDMDTMIRTIKNSERINADQEIYIHGEKSFKRRGLYLKKGIPIHEKTIEELKNISEDLKINFNLKEKAK